MKKATLIITAVLACAILCYAAYVWTLVDNYPYKIWLHRCNSIEKQAVQPELESQLVVL